MKNFFQIIIYIFINLNLYESIIVLPLYRINPYKNITSIYEFINDLQPNNLYTKLKIGGPAQEIKVVIKEEEMAFSINSLYCNFESFYNRNESKTFETAFPLPLQKAIWQNLQIPGNTEEAQFSWAA